jgi:hypothetical protein
MLVPFAFWKPRASTSRRAINFARSYRDTVGDELADMIDVLTMNPVERRQVVRLLSEIEASSRP